VMAAPPLTLCMICDQINFNELFNHPARECHDECFQQTLPSSQYDYGTLADLQERSFSCTVCEFLVDAWIRGARQPERVRPTDSLMMKRWRRKMESPLAWTNLFGVEIAAPTASCVQFGPKGNEYAGLVLAFQPPAMDVNNAGMVMFRTYTDRELISGNVNFPWIRSWFNACQSHHTGCQLPVRTPSEAARGRIFGPGEMKLIDVHTRQVIDYEGQPYLALSYVCAQAGTMPENTVAFEGRTLPAQLPGTLEDAIKATADLGERYLWIDAYCIDQTDEVIKTQLIQKMDLVYESAKLTLCALSQQASGGIYGMSLPVERFDQVVRQTELGTFLTVQIPRLVQQINRSAWNSRGWTLQEAVISRRCLMFTSSGVALWCRSQLYHEAFDFRNALTTGDAFQGPRPYGIMVSRLPFSFRIDSGSARTEWQYEIWNQIVFVYSSRSLTVQSDADKAIAGIFN
jgi:hypothetical protein